MHQDRPAEPGMPLDEIDTPALVIDLGAFERNLDRMGRLAAASGVAVRPHAKTHKSPVIARLQAARGAVGQCVQKVGEAEVLAWGGVSDILVSNEVVGPRKLARLAALSRVCTVALCADGEVGIDRAAAAAEGAGLRLTLLVEIDVGGGRCGVRPGSDAVALARRIAGSRHLRFGGLQSYHGSAQHLRSPEERDAAIAGAARMTGEVVGDLRDIGLACAIVGGAGTGTFAREAASGVYTELQVGSYAFMDADYARNRPAPDFEHALFVLAGVMSVTRPGLAIVDCGHKGIAVDSGPPLVWQRPGVTCLGCSDEHGTLNLTEGAEPLAVGQKVLLVPGHCDPTVDRHDWYVGVRNGRVEGLWPVAARGAMA